MSGLRLFFSFISIFWGVYLHSQPKDELTTQWKKCINALSVADTYAGNYKSDPLISDRLYKKAREQYSKFLELLSSTPNDSLQVIAYNQLGFLYYYFDSISSAKAHYLHAIRLKDQKQFNLDSSFFLSYIFTGSIYYRENSFDSAAYYFKRAETINARYKTNHPESQRLYNWLGGMYYETGNYKQAANYFEKALSLLSPTNPYARDLSIRYENNIASSLTKMEQYSQADTIYEKLINKGINTNELINNRGIVNLKSGNFNKALQFFKSVSFDSDLKITLFNNLGYTYAMLGQTDSAELYYTKALEENSTWNAKRQNIKHGYTFQNIGKLKESKGLLIPALEAYQEALMQFYPSFTKNDIYSNPDTFSGIFSYIDIFNVLISKGEVFEKLFMQSDSLRYLDASLNSFQSAFRLVYYVDQMYDSDDARLFLNKIKYGVHDKPIQLSLKGFQHTHNTNYLTQAYFFDQNNKASILSYNQQAQSIKNKNKNITALFDQERLLKTKITRLILKSNQYKDSLNIAGINTSIRDIEIELSKIQVKKNEYPQFKSLPQNIPDISELQKKIAPGSSVISYHLSQNKLVAICITQNDVVHSIVSIDSVFYSNIGNFRESLDPEIQTNRNNGNQISQYLYEKLISPSLPLIKNKKELIIIPDDELNSLPFEALKDGKGRYLIENFVIHYQYSASLLLPTVNFKKQFAVLAMAPFANQGTATYSQLKYSGQEIESLPGTILLNQSATKEAFLKNINKYPILHLATHTNIDEHTPENSHIAFNPSLDSFESNLYLPEIYNLQLDSTALVIISACESAHGKLTKGEGLMSLSRSFYYAGCPHIIASLWKADDQSTAWIIKAFYSYLQKGNSFSYSLSKAKLDYLHSSEIESQFKAPYYWAHLVLTGELEENAKKSRWMIYTGAVLFLLVVWILFKRKQPVRF